MGWTGKIAPMALWLAASGTVMAATPAPSATEGVRNVPGFALPLSPYLSPEAQAAMRSAVVNGDPVAKMDNATVLKELAAIRRGADAWAYGEIQALRERYPVELHHERWNGVPVVRVEPHSAPADPAQRRLLIELHGGAFVFGRADSLGLLEAIPVAAMTGATVVAVECRSWKICTTARSISGIHWCRRCFQMRYWPGFRPRCSSPPPARPK